MKFAVGINGTSVSIYISYIHVWTLHADQKNYTIGPAQAVRETSGNPGETTGLQKKKMGGAKTPQRI